MWYQKSEFKWFDGSFAQRVVQFFCYVGVVILFFLILRVFPHAHNCMSCS